MRRLIVAPAARRDAAAVLRDSRAGFGLIIRERYDLLLRTAYKDLAANPKGAGVRPTEVIPGAFSYHIRHSRSRVKVEDRIQRPRHVVLFSYDDASVRILRVLHDRMDVLRRLNEPDLTNRT